MKRLTRERWLILLTTLAIALRAQSQKTPFRIHIHIYNYAGISDEALARAEQETARIFRRVGVLTEWLDCPLNAEEPSRNNTCDVPAASARFTLRLLSNTMAERFPLGHDFFGFALLPVSGGFGVMANVFAERAKEMAGSTASLSVILGDLMAHELGHLLLSQSAHSVAGIMRGEWRTRELQKVAEGTLFFLPEQAQKIRTQVLARMIGGGQMK